MKDEQCFLRFNAVPLCVGFCPMALESHLIALTLVNHRQMSRKRQSLCQRDQRAKSIVCGQLVELSQVGFVKVCGHVHDRQPSDGGLEPLSSSRGITNRST